MQDFHPFEAHDNRRKSYSENRKMSAQHPVKVHEHVAKRVHVLLQRAGVPYEIEQQVCTSCSRVLDEKPVRRAAA
jgi:NMD protein affecting ribosome stability and mRNA decay